MTTLPLRAGGLAARIRLRRRQARRLLRILRVITEHAAAHLAGRGRSRLALALVRRLPAPGLQLPERLRTVFEELGGTVVKFGQMLALQPDILSLEHCNALLKLLDRMEPFPYADVERTFREDLGRPPEEVFDHFESAPFAAASVGQVHRAWLDDRKLAVKVRRPSVVTDFAGDLELMRAAMAWIRGLRLRPLYWLLEPMGEFVAWTEEELDYRCEACYLERLRLNARDNPKEKIPEVVWELSGERILVLEFVDGPSVLDYVRALEGGDEVAVRRLGVSGFEPAAYAQAVIENFLSDAFLNGIFHADLHPANLLILPGNVVGYIDFGITGVLSAYSRRHLVTMTLAYTRGDLDAMCEAFFKVSTYGGDNDAHGFRDGLWRLASGWYEDDSGRRRPRCGFTRVMLDMLRLSRSTGVLPEREVVKYIRSAIAVDGLISRFAPGFDLGEHLQETCGRLLRREARRSMLRVDRWLSDAVATGRLVRDGGARVSTLLDSLADGGLPVAADRPAKGRRRVAPRLPEATAVAATATLLLVTFDPSPLGANLFTAQLLLAAAGLAVVARCLWLARRPSVLTAVRRFHA